jgi:O-antigen/teichoic acid export membrane protein
MRLSTHSKNILFLFSGEILARFFGFLATIYLARILGTDKFGVIHIGLAVLAYGIIVGNSGLNYLGTRTVSGNQGDIAKTTGQILVNRMLLSVFAFIVASVIVAFFVTSAEVKGVIIVYLLYLFPTALILDWYFQGKQQMGAIASGRLLAMMVYLIFILIFVRTNQDTVNVAWSWVVGALANMCLLFFIFIYKKNHLIFSWKFNDLTILISKSYTLGGADLISQIVLLFPAIYLAIAASNSAVGEFSAAFKIIILLLIFDRVFLTVFYPIISRCFYDTPEQLSSVFNNVLKMVSVFSFYVGLCAFMSADFLIQTIFGEQFLASTTIFQILVVYFIFTMINSVITFTLIGMEKERVYMKSLIAGMIVFAMILLLSGISLGTTGAAIAIVFYIITSLIIMAVKLKKTISFSLTKTMLLPSLLSIVIILLFNNLIIMPLPLKLFVITILGLPLLALACGIGLSEIRYLRRSLIWN